MMHHRLSALPFALALLAPLPLLAAGTATLDNGNESNEFVWQDTQTARINLPAEDGYMVLREGKLYMVNTNAGSGMPPVVEIGDMMQGMVEAFADDASPLSQKVDSLTKTGQTETIAGIKGDLYDVVLVNDQGETRSDQLVLTGDALAVEMTAAYLAVSEALVGAKRVDAFREALPKGQRGLLRLGDDMSVQSLSKDQPATDAFDLPAEPVDFANMMQQMMEQMQKD